jgi:hypothetical protein
MIILMEHVHLPRQAWDKHNGIQIRNGFSTYMQALHGKISVENTISDITSYVGTGMRERVFLSHLYLNAFFLPRQARDRHRESTLKKER